MNKLRKSPSGFTMVPNALIRSDALSLKAKGLYCLLFSKPDNWIYMEEALVKESADGRESYRSGIKELVESGWLSKVQVRDDKGVFSHIDWHLSVDGKPVVGEAVDGETVAGESPPNNTDLIKTEEVIPSVSPEPTKASTRAVPVRSLAVILEDLTSIPTELVDRAGQLGVNLVGIDDEWAKFRNHHISARSKHTRVDLCWDTWCRNAAKWQGRGKAPAGGGAGQGGFKRHDPVASAKDRVLAELFGIGAEGHGRPPADEDAGTYPFGDGTEAADASFVDVGSGNEASQLGAGGAGGSDTHSNVGTAISVEEQRGAAFAGGEGLDERLLGISLVGSSEGR